MRLNKKLSVLGIVAPLIPSIMKLRLVKKNEPTIATNWYKNGRI